jgi:class 3 adenylate cyclase/predicted ATPase
MDYRVLGPLEVRDGEQSLPLTGAKQRALFALLLLNANHVVSRDRLIDELWGEQPPKTAVQILQVMVSRLRKLLPRDTLLTRPPGYVLEVAPGELDLRSFEDLLAEGRQALSTGDAKSASTILRHALELWRGPALPEFAFEPFAQAEIGRLEDLRLIAVEERIEADLAVGRHADLIGELEALIAENPHRERLRSQVILALYRSGRQAEALRAYQGARKALDELGLEPSAALQELEKRILNQDEALDAPMGQPSAASSAAPRPLVRKVVTVVFAALEMTNELEEDPEHATAFFDRVHRQAAAEIEAAGGTVEKGIAGALLATFGVPTADDADHAARAVGAALATRNRLREVFGEQLSLRMAIESGEVILGRPGSFVSGTPVAAAARLVRFAQPGEVVIGQRTATVVVGAFALKERNGAYVVAPPQGTCPDCGGPIEPAYVFCPVCGASLAEPAAGAPAQERKIVTVLFVDLVGFTARASRLDPEEVRELLVPYYAKVRAKLQSFGGTVEKFIGDAAMALFGAPVAHEDDPERAVRAGRAVLQALEELNADDPRLGLHVRIGINTGEAVVSLGARPSHGESLAAGDVLNTAARLQVAAPPGGILVGETTHAATRDVIEYGRVEPIDAKGKAGAVQAWRVLGARPIGSRAAGIEAPLVGRSREQQALVDAVERIRRERIVQLVTLIGVPGIGKSRLVSELMNSLNVGPNAATTRVGRSVPYGEGVTFWALAEIVKEQAGIDELDSAAAAEEKLHEAVVEIVPDATDASWIEGHLRTLAGVSLGDGPHGDGRSEAFGAWRRFFELLAERAPLVLVFEDLHWADAGLLDFVDHLVDSALSVPLLVVATARPELLEHRPSWGGGKRNAISFSLPPLSPEETKQLFAALLDRTDLAEDFETTLLERSGGNPLYAGEYVRMLGDRGLLDRGGGVQRSENLPMPPSVQAVIAARLDALGPEGKTLLQAAAVLGERFTVEALAKVDGRAVTVVEEGLLSLERRDFVTRTRGLGGRSFSFRHALVRDVAYGQIARAGRLKRHRRAAEWIESLGRPVDQAETLAHHYVSALKLARLTGVDAEDLPTHARVALTEAGERALSLDAYASAARFFGEALELMASDDPGRAAVQLRLGRALIDGRLEGAGILEDARKSALEGGDRELAAEADVLLYALAASQGKGGRAAEHLDRARELVRTSPQSPTKALVLSNTARYLMQAGKEAEAVEVGRDGLAMAEALGLDSLRASVLVNIGTARVSGGDAGGIDDIERGIELAKEMPSVVLRALRDLASAHILLGDLRRAFPIMAEARTLAERLGHGSQARWLSAALAIEAYWRGEWDDAGRTVDALLEEAKAGRPHYMDAICYFVRGHIRLARGSAPAAGEDAAAGLETARRSKEEWLLAPTLAFASWAAFEGARGTDAIGYTDELFGFFRERKPLSTFWLADFAAVVAKLGRGAELVAIADDIERPTPWLVAATAVASGAFAEAAEVYEEIGSAPDAAYVRLQAGRSSTEPERSAQVERALDFYGSVSASRYIREAEAVQAGMVDG